MSNLTKSQIIDAACAVMCDKLAKKILDITQLIHLNALTMAHGWTEEAVQQEWAKAGIDDVTLDALKRIVNR